MPNPTTILLVVANLKVSLEDIARVVRERSPDKCLVVTSHRMFSEERNRLRCLLPGTCRLTCRTLSSFHNDTSLAACDQEAARDVNSLAGSASFNTFFMRRSNYLKNRKAFESMQTEFNIGEALYASGLGISDAFWREVPGANPLLMEGKLPPMRQMAHQPGGFLQSFFRRACRRKEIFAYFEQDQAYLFPRWNRRLLVNRPPDRVFGCPGWLSALHRPVRAARDWSRRRLLAKLANEHGVSQFAVCGTLHAPPDNRPDIPGRRIIFSDGHLPGNYERTYLDSYGDALFCPRSFAEAKFFERHGFKTIAPPPFFAPLKLAAPLLHDCASIRTAVLLLNHAGDWSALISRSDTDRLVEAFCLLARHFPGIMFIVRPHPGMAHPDHEGEGAIERLKTLIANRPEPNLLVSDQSLNEDLDRGDVFVSEYSNTLIDVYRSGRIGLIANLTGRRSFMADFEELGFPAVASAKDLLKWFSAAIDNPRSICDSLGNGAGAFNSLQERWLTGTP